MFITQKHQTCNQRRATIEPIGGSWYITVIERSQDHPYEHGIGSKERNTLLEAIQWVRWYTFNITITGLTPRTRQFTSRV